MSTLRKNVTISVEEYLEGEKWSDIKHETRARHRAVPNNP
jgi:hypothetical protein